MAHNKAISSYFLKLLSRPVRGMVHFNDVFFEREVDFDAELTVTLRNLGEFQNLFFPIGSHPIFGSYGAVLLDDLIKEEKRILERIKQGKNSKMYKELKTRLNQAIITVINCAPRSALTTRNGMNGEDFHLAITANGLEIYAVPLVQLEALETRNRILALYRIPNDSLRSTDGTLEQFRSSIIATTRYFPETLEKIFEYGSLDELIAAKNNGLHPEIIPKQTQSIKLAFVDKFGNVRISVLDNENLLELCGNPSFGSKLKIKVGNSDAIEATFVRALKDIPQGEMGIYQNINDELSNGSNATYWEIVRKSEDPNNEQNPASTTLEKLNANYFSEEIFISS